MYFEITALCCFLFSQVVDSKIAAKSQLEDVDVYDYIVVGGGTAGVALSTRLSEGLPSSKILLIEAGPDGRSDLGINVPGRKGTTVGTKFDWNLTTVPQAALKNRILPQTRGHVLGGSSAINLLTYDRATAHEYDGWGEVGNHGWNFTSFLESMKLSENFTSKNTQYYGDAGVSTNGPVCGTINRVIPAHQAAWIPTLENVGLEWNREYLGGYSIGASYSSSSIDPRNYTRSYSASAYLPLAGPNLTVLTDTKVAKINLRNGTENYLATGVTLINGTIFTARKEVILSAGSLHSPGLLELSGIGRGSVLQEAGIPQLIDLSEVGEHLQDHIRLENNYQLKDSYTSFDILRYNTTYAAEQLQLWKDGKLSLYDYTGSGYSFFNWKQAIGNDSTLKALAKATVGSSTNPASRKHLEWLSDPTIPQLEVIMSDGYTGLKGYPATGSPLYGKGFFSLIAAIMHPLSQGSVHINASDPLGKPIIDPKYLSNEYDVQAAIAAVKKNREIALTPPLRDVWVSEYEPGLEFQTDAEWKDFVLNTTLSIYHPVGTAAMLPRKDGGVVDSKLKVYGTSNLRVVDASIIPVLISAHLQTAVYGIAETAAKFILDDAKSC